MFSKFFHFQAIIRGHTFAPSGKLIITRNDETVSPCPGWFAISTLPPILLFPKCYLLLQLLCVMSYYVIRNETVRLISYLPNPLHISCGATFPVARLHCLGYLVSFSRVVSRVVSCVSRLVCYFNVTPNTFISQVLFAVAVVMCDVILRHQE